MNFDCQESKPDVLLPWELEILCFPLASYLATRRTRFRKKFIVDMIEINPTKEVPYGSLSRNPVLAGVSQASFKKNTLRTYQSVLSKFSAQFGERDLASVTPDEILSFLTEINQGTKQLTKKTRYSQLASFFNFVIENLDSNFRSPCDTPMLKKFYRAPGLIRWNILGKGSR